MKNITRLFYLLIILGFVACKTENPDLQTLVKGRWFYEKITDSIGAKTLKEVALGDSMFLDGNNQFNYSLSKEKIESSGTWKLEDSTLIFDYKQGVIDSTCTYIYDTDLETGHTDTVVMKNWKSIAKYVDGVLVYTNVQRKYKVLLCNRFKLKMEENGTVFYFNRPAEKSTTELGLGAKIFNGFLGITFLLLVLFLVSEKKKKISWQLVISALVLQIIFALLVMKVPFVKTIFDKISSVFIVILGFTKEGSNFLFGSLMNTETYGFVFIFQVLPTIIFFAALSALLYYLGILQRIVWVFAWIMKKTMKLSGAESLAAAANIFIGQTEAPLLIKPYLEKMTRSEMMALMIGGMATIAGGVLAAYVGFLGGTSVEEQQMFASHLLSASIMSAPASLLAAKMIIPETEVVDDKLSVSKDKIGSNILDAISIGTTDGLKLAVNVGAMLLVFTALMAMLNFLFLHFIGNMFHINDYIYAYTLGAYEGLNLQFILSQVFSPVAWLLGVRGEDVALVGQLLGEKTILNEFYAYGTMGTMKIGGMFADERSVIIATYALCGFANFASIGIQIGGIGSLAPNKRALLSSLGIKALIGGTVACLLTAAIAGILV